MIEPVTALYMVITVVTSLILYLKVFRYHDFGPEMIVVIPVMSLFWPLLLMVAILGIIVQSALRLLS